MIVVIEQSVTADPVWAMTEAMWPGSARSRACVFRPI
jgi:hypothetical protein